MHNTAPPPRHPLTHPVPSDACHKELVPGTPTAFVQVATHWRFPHPLPQVQSVARAAHRTQKSSLLAIANLPQRIF